MTALAAKQTASLDDFDVTSEAAYKLSDFAPYREWYRLGDCIEFSVNDPDFFFSRSTELVAKTICNTMCKVRTQCRNYALVNEIPYGVWGGLSGGERAAFTIKQIRLLQARARYEEAIRNGLSHPEPVKLQVVQ